MLLSYDVNICSFMRARLVANTEHNGKKYNTILSLELETASANPSMRSSIRSLYLMNHNNQHGLHVLEHLDEDLDVQ